jgi:hypothetical protein
MTYARAQPRDSARGSLCIEVCKPLNHTIRLLKFCTGWAFCECVQFGAEKRHSAEAHEAAFGFGIVAHRFFISVARLAFNL